MQTLTQKLKNQITADYVISGLVPVGGKLPTVRAIADKYKTNVTTVGKVIAVLAAEGVVTKKQGSGIFCSKDAKYIVPNSSSSKKIGFIVHDINESIGHLIMTGIEEIASNHNCSIEIANSNHDVALEKSRINSMISRGVDGIILEPVANRNVSAEYLATEYREFPIVVVDTYRAVMKRPHIVFDNYRAGYDMASYLIGRDCQRIAFYKFDDSHTSLEHRLAGYKTALRENKIAYNSELVVSKGILTDMRKQGHENFISVIKDLIALDPAPDAIMAPMDYCTSLFMSYINKYAPSQAGKIIVSGFDNDLTCRRADFYLEGEMTQWPTTSPDFKRMGSRAAELMIEILENARDRNQEVEVLLPCPLLLPGTTKTEMQCTHDSCVAVLK